MRITSCINRGGLIMVIVTIEVNNEAYIGRAETVDEAYSNAIKNMELASVPTKGRAIWEQ
jgi:hypothetical protein